MNEKSITGDGNRETSVLIKKMYSCVPMFERKLLVLFLTVKTYSTSRARFKLKHREKLFAINLADMSLLFFSSTVNKYFIWQLLKFTPAIVLEHVEIVIKFKYALSCQNHANYKRKDSTFCARMVFKENLCEKTFDVCT